MLMLASMVAMPVMASHKCDVADQEYFNIQVHNHTDVVLHIDLGDPKYGEVDQDRSVSIAPHSSNTAVACSDGMFRGLETRVRLYYLADWYVNQPYKGQKSIKFSSYSSLCHVYYYTMWIDSHGKQHYPKYMTAEPTMIHTYDHDIFVDVSCG